MQIRTVDEARGYRAGKMAKIHLFETTRMFCDVYCLGPGQEQSPHSHADGDKIYYVLEGEPRALVGAEERSLRPGDVVLAPAGVIHGVRNPTAQPARLLVFMAPNPNPNPDPNPES